MQLAFSGSLCRGGSNGGQAQEPCRVPSLGRLLESERLNCALANMANAFNLAKPCALVTSSIRPKYALANSKWCWCEPEDVLRLLSKGREHALFWSCGIRSRSYTADRQRLGICLPVSLTGGICFNYVRVSHSHSTVLRQNFATS